jgi:hypothetical protein
LDEPLTELSACFRRDARLPDQEPIRLTAAARAGGSRREAIAAAWGVNSVDGDWAAAVCDDCYAGLHPGITVTVKCYPARWPADGRTVAVIRQRTRGDHDYPDIGHFPDIGQAMTWQLWWQHGPMLVEEAGQPIAAGLAARHWPPGAAGLPCVVSAYPEF